MEVKEKVEHPLILKVMRMTRPYLGTPVIVTCESKDLPGDLLNMGLKDDPASISGMETLAIGEFLLIPQSFGSIYLGETFSCYICIHNRSEEAVDNIILKADLQTTSHRFMLVDGAIPNELIPEATYDKVIRHEVKEVGTHILVCEVSYKQDLSFRKFFKFQVLKPLDVKTKFYVAESDEVYLEAEIQNFTCGPICFENVRLRSSADFIVKDLNTSISSKKSIFGEINIVNKELSRQYLYYLSPRQNSSSIISDELINVGILDILWRSSLGAKGHLQTSMLQTLSSERDNIRLSMILLPNVVFVNKPFKFRCRITNLANFEINLLLILEETDNFIWCAKSNRHLENLIPSQSTDITLQLIPESGGLQDIGGIKLTDDNLQQCYTFNNIAQVFVL